MIFSSRNDMAKSTGLIALAIILVACSDPQPPLEIDDHHVDAGAGDIDSGDVDGADIDESRCELDHEWSYENSGDEAFELPEDGEEVERQFLPPDQEFWGHLRYPREPVVESEDGALWLEGGEYFIADGIFQGPAYAYHAWGEGEHRFFALAHGEMIPIRVVEVPDEESYPTKAEIECWEPEEFSRQEVIDIQFGRGINYTLVIPPWAFPYLGAHQIHFFVMPPYESSEEGGFLNKSDTFLDFVPFMSKSLIYYGGQDYHREAAEFREREAQSDQWEDDIWIYVGHNRGLLLAPPEEMVPLPETQEWDDAEYRQQFITREINPTIGLYIGDEHPGTSFSWGGRFRELGLQERTLIYVLQDWETIDVFWIHPQGWGADEKLDIEVELEPGEESIFQVIGTAHPYDPEVHPKDYSFATESNAIRLRHIPK